MTTARAYSNIAFIKYWGNRDNTLRLPVNGSISMNLAGLETVTTVRFDSTLTADSFTLNGQVETGGKLSRVSEHLDHFRQLAGVETRAEVVSNNSFPTGAGIASSASAFAALTLAAAGAVGLELSEQQASALARRGSGSASRSIPGGFVEWIPGTDHDSSYAVTIAPPEHWDLIDLVAIVSVGHKSVGSTKGHAAAPTSPLQQARVVDAPRRTDLCRAALLERDFEAFTEIVELDALMMHAVMMTSTPTLLYWEPATVAVMHAVRAWRAEGVPCCFTIDAGANVHVITPGAHAGDVEQRLRQLEGVQDVLRAGPGGAAHLVEIDD